MFITYYIILYYNLFFSKDSYCYYPYVFCVFDTKKNIRIITVGGCVGDTMLDTFVIKIIIFTPNVSSIALITVCCVYLPCY